jgi:DivIVA domain-containing protein
LALGRQDIERRDFPIGRRGYDTDAVDAHLRRVAEEVEGLIRDAGRDSLAGAASEQVKAIVEAAESTAAEIRRTAEDESRQIRTRAQTEADESRSDAAEQAAQHLTRVREATQALLERVDGMERELGTLVESLRAGASRLTSDLSQLQSSMDELRASPAGREAGPAPEPLAEPAPATRMEEAEARVTGEAEAAPTSGDDDAEGARLIALNMALNGTPREETARYLEENFQLDDRESLLDEVYARVG